MPKTNADYVTFVKYIKDTFFDGIWSESNGWFELDEGYGLFPITEVQAAFVGAVAVLANNGIASVQDKSRAIILLDKLINIPANGGYAVADINGTGGATWWRVLNTFNDSTGRAHPSTDMLVAEALYLCWKYRTDLALSQARIDRIVEILTNECKWPADDTGGPVEANRWYNPTSLAGFSMTAWNNQTATKWGLNRVIYRKLIGINSYDSVITDGLADFLATVGTYTVDREPNYYLLPDFTWKYADSWPYPAMEYGQMCLGGVSLYWNEVASLYSAYPQGHIDILKAWSRQCLGEWCLNGYLNWDTYYGSQRIYSLDYWAWSLSALGGIARWPNNQHSDHNEYAKYLLDAAIDLWHTTTDRDNLTPDGAPQAAEGIYKNPATWPFFYFAYHIIRATGAARFMHHYAVFASLGIGDLPATAPRNLWSWGWANTVDAAADKTMQHMTLHVSTPHYSAAVVPYGPEDNASTYDGVQRQNWTLSHIQTPDNRLLTGSGGMGLESFSCQVTVGAEELHSDSTIPTQVMVVDGVQQNRTDWDTSTIPATFNNDILAHHYSESTNYRMIGITRFYQRYIRTTYNVKCIGTAGNGSVVVSIPTLEGATITYVMADDTTTTIYAGSTITPINRLIDCKYIHIAYDGMGLLIVPRDISGGTGASVTMSSTVPSTYPERQPDQERSLLITLISGATVNAAKLSLDYHITNGTNAAEVYDSMYDLAGTVRNSNLRGGVVRT